ncbi:MAG: hypothetical protein HY048_16680 [Acidobacteria bacterium]|nr:hypothetical protein [Acidobacteriota bacterium]
MSLDAPLAQIEQSLVDEFLRSRGYDRHTVELLPDAERHALLSEASVYASSKLTEVESRSHYLDEIRERGT